MTALEECTAQAERLRARMKEYQGELKEEADPSGTPRCRLKSRRSGRR